MVALATEDEVVVEADLVIEVGEVVVEVSIDSDRRRRLLAARGHASLREQN